MGNTLHPDTFICLKPLDRIARDTVFLLDDAVEAYGWNLDRVLPVRAWHGYRNDHTLLDMVPYLEQLAKLPHAEMRDYVRMKHGLGDYIELGPHPPPTLDNGDEEESFLERILSDEQASCDDTNGSVELSFGPNDHGTSGTPLADPPISSDFEETIS